MGEGMWLRDWSAGRMALLRVATTAFGGLDRAAQTADYRVLPSLPEGNRQNRYIGDWLLYGNTSWYSDEDDRPAGELAYALRYADRGEVDTLHPRHGVERIEAMGSDAVLVGNRGTNLLFTAVKRGAARARVRDTFGLANASQGDGRTHGFFYRNDAEQTGIVGLPVLREGGRTGPYGESEGSAAVLYLRHRQRGDPRAPSGGFHAAARWRACATAAAAHRQLNEVHAMTSRFRAACLFLLLQVTVIPTAAADEPSSNQVGDRAAIMERICAQMTCQHDVRVKLTRADGIVFDRSYPVMPTIVQGSRFAVLAGQMVFIEADLVDERLTNLRAMDRVVDAAKKLTARFEHTTDGGMLLELHNPVDECS